MEGNQYMPDLAKLWSTHLSKRTRDCQKDILPQVLHPEGLASCAVDDCHATPVGVVVHGPAEPGLETPYARLQHKQACLAFVTQTQAAAVTSCHRTSYLTTNPRQVISLLIQDTPAARPDRQ